MATEPPEFTELVSRCRDIPAALGSKERVLSQQELDQRRNMRRSIVSAREIKAGEVIRETDLCAKRPGTGIAPTAIDCVVGRRAKADIPADTIVLPEQLN